jgi:adenylate cyclase
MTLRADAIRACMDGSIPGALCTCSADGIPNVAYLSQVQYVDPDHVALSYQFFNHTRRNILANPRAAMVLVHPKTAQQYRLSMEYLRTETAGPLFERMKARLAGIASHTGMSEVFKLLGSDVYRVLDIEQLPGEPLPAPVREQSLLPALRACSERISACEDLADLLETALDDLTGHFGLRHAMVLLLDAAGDRLYTVASRGYEASGVGAEIPVGQGIIGVAAREAVPIRIEHMTSEYTYGQAIRGTVAQGDLADRLETAIPLPGLPAPGSQLAVPIPGLRYPLGVLFMESPEELRFTYDDEDAAVALAGQLGLAIRLLQSDAEAPEEAGPLEAPAIPGGRPAVVRHYAENDSVFLDAEYLIKGVAGSILWALLQDHLALGRTDFTNRELRLDPRVRLPDVSDNLEARLVLLNRRLQERAACIQIERTGRGRFRLRVDHPLQLTEAPGRPPRQG